MSFSMLDKPRTSAHQGVHAAVPEEPANAKTFLQATEIQPKANGGMMCHFPVCKIVHGQRNATASPTLRSAQVARLFLFSLG